MMDVHARCIGFLRRLSKIDSQIPHGDILIVGHGGTLRMLLAELLDLSPESSRIFRFDNCSLTTVVQRENAPPLLAAYNDTIHLRSADLFWTRV
jgi:broad specificity phosphatase PhoE